MSSDEMKAKESQFDFDTICKGSPDLHSLLVECSGIAYLPQVEAEKKLANIGYKGTDVIFFQTGLTAGFVLTSRRLVVVAFRGSHTVREWLNNANVYPKRTAFGRIHAGFCRTVEEVAPSLLPLVERKRGPRRVIYVTGHSRGGALAALFATLLLANNLPAGFVIFGSPRYCDAEFANHFTPTQRASEWTTYIPGPIIYVCSLSYSAIVLGWCFIVAPRLAKLLAIVRKPVGEEFTAS
jgi:hypothetical protein